MVEEEGKMRAAQLKLLVERLLPGGAS
jgi:hypothetical protein